MQAYIEGPYGAPMIDLHGDRFEAFFIITSGMGWTFLRAWKRQLLQEASRGRRVQLLRTVAIMRSSAKYLTAEFSGWSIDMTAGALPPIIHAKA